LTDQGIAVGAPAPETAGRRQDGTFAPGHSGNPHGRPHGARNRATVAAQALLDGEAETLTRRAVELALGGDVGALRLCVERILPPVRERPVEVELPTVVVAADLPQVVAALLSAVARGELLPSEGEALAALVGALREALAVELLESRVAEVERRLGVES
jgi:hypothetical protein